MLRQLLQRVLVLIMLTVLVASCSSRDNQAAAEIQVVDAATGATVTAVPTTAPVALPTATSAPTTTAVPTAAPTAVPTAVPTAAPMAVPTAVPTAAPTAVPTPVPAPTEVPTVLPTAVPTAAPAPTALPTAVPTVAPTEAAAAPTAAATSAPAAAPSEPGLGGPPSDHVVTNVGYVTLGQAGEVSLVLPVARIERIGFHEASHPGAQAINAAFTGAPTMVLESRGRNTPARSAADIVIPPDEPVLAPATGTVIAANSYILYCEHQDRLVYIEPDGLPGWQVRVFHVNGPLPAVGDRVVAGQTPIGTGANLFPFESQIDEFTAEPSWAHVHVEVVDTSVPDTRPPGPGCP